MKDANKILDRIKHLIVEAEVCNKNIQLILADLSNLVKEIMEFKNEYDRNNPES